MKKVFVLSKEQFGVKLGYTIQSGYDMVNVRFQDNSESFIYPSDIIETEGISNVNLWTLIENSKLPKGAILKNQKEEQIIFNGVTFIPFHKDDVFTRLCKGDIWNLIGIQY